MNNWLVPTFGAFFLWGIWSFIPKIITQYISPKSAILFEVLGGVIIALIVLVSLNFVLSITGFKHNIEKEACILNN